MNDFVKLVRVGKTRDGHVHCKIKWRDGRLSITGVVGAMRNGNAKGGCGQIVMSIRGEAIDYAPGWDAELASRFWDAWDAHHLNDMQAGSPAQMAELARVGKPPAGTDHYSWAQTTLREAGLNPDRSCIVKGAPYHYGSAWLSAPVPADVLAFFVNLPERDIPCAWGDD